MDDDALVRDEAGAVGGPMKMIEEKGCDALAYDISGRRQFQPLVQHPVMEVGVELIGLCERIRDDQCRLDSECSPRLHDFGDLSGGRNGPVDDVAAVAEIEAGKDIRSVTEHSDVQGLQTLEGGADIKDGLHSGADDGHGSGAHGCEVGGLIPARARFPMHAAEPAGGEDLDPCARCDLACRRDGGGAVAASGRHGRDVADRNLDDVVTISNLIEEVPRETDMHDPGQHGDSRWYCTSRPDDVLDLNRDAKVFRPW